jgi:hypothetical protein
VKRCIGIRILNYPPIQYIHMAITIGGGKELPKNEQIKKSIVLGSGAIKIGEAGESQKS